MANLISAAIGFLTPNDAHDKDATTTIRVALKTMDFIEFGSCTIPAGERLYNTGEYSTDYRIEIPEGIVITDAQIAHGLCDVRILPQFPDSWIFEGYLRFEFSDGEYTKRINLTKRAVSKDAPETTAYW